MYARVSCEYITPGVTLVSGLQQKSEDSVEKQIRALLGYTKGADEQIRLLTEVPSPLAITSLIMGPLTRGSAGENGEGVWGVLNHG